MKHRGVISAGAVALATTVAVIIGTIVPSPKHVAESTKRLGLFPTRGAYEIAATRDFWYNAVPTARPGWGVFHRLPQTGRIMRRDLHEHGNRFIVKTHGAWGTRVRNLDETMEFAIDHLRHTAPFGEIAPDKAVVVVKALQDGFRVVSRKVDRNPAIVLNTEGTRAIDIIVGTTAVAFPNVQNYGIYVCKYIAGTRNLSQHSFANAVDFGGSTTLLDQIARFQYRLWQQGYLPVSQIIWRGRDIISGHPVYDHYNHIHDSGLPLLHYSTCQRAA